MMSSVLDHALSYAQRGWAVFPLLPSRKEPAIAHGFQAASKDPAQIRAWWGHGSPKGIGIATGAVSGLWVLDIDQDKGGYLSWDALLRDRAEPRALRVRTGGGGLHLYFSLPPGESARSRIGIEPGIDARGDGGYVVAPPSMHQSGLAYAWDGADERLHVAPGWLTDLVQGRAVLERPKAPDVRSPPAYARAALERETEAVRSAPEGERNERLNVAAFSLARLVTNGWLDAGAVADELQVAAEASGLGAAEARKTIASGLGAPRPATARPPTAIPACLPSGDPLPVAEAYARTQTDSRGRLTLRRWRGQWWGYGGSAYEEIGAEAMEARLWAWAGALYVATKDGPKPYAPTGAKISNVLSALRAVSGVMVDDSVEPPCWVGDGPDGVGIDVVPVANGLLDLRRRKLLDPTPSLFATSALPVEWSDAPAPPESWLAFLRSLWPDEGGEAGLLRAWFGYCLTPDTAQQKMLMLTGPKRSGKGTIARALVALVGRKNSCGPTLSGMGTPFGLQPMLGKLVGIIGDARISGRTDQAVIVERLLSITGEDAVTIDRKNREMLTAQLPTRLVLLSNEVPALRDSSGALASRMLFLPLAISAYGAEDVDLGRRIAAEMPGILRWAVDGWHDLRRAGRFPATASQTACMEAMMSLGSPIAAFVEDSCEIGPDRWVSLALLYERYRTWAGEQGVRPTSLAIFARDLTTVVPGAGTSKKRLGSAGRMRIATGVALVGELEAWH